ncbi:MAG: hypothetical protein AABZ74_07090 [Cyanobacteriota bacterium]
MSNSGYNISKKLKLLHDIRKDCDYSKELELGDIGYLSEKSFFLSNEIFTNLENFSNYFENKFKLK